MNNPQLLLDKITSRFFGTRWPTIGQLRSFKIAASDSNLQHGGLPIAITLIMQGPRCSEASLRVYVEGVRDFLLTGWICNPLIEGHLFFEEIRSTESTDQQKELPSGLWKLAGHDEPGFFIVATSFQFAAIIPPYSRGAGDTNISQ